jgi:hypothetical protein
MAQELLQRTSKIHLYRHDVESLFWIMLMMCGRHSIEEEMGDGKEAKMQVVMREGRLPYEDWFNERKYTALGLSKESFFMKVEAIELSPQFEDFRGWLRGLQHCFSEGFKLQRSRSQQGPLVWLPSGFVGGVKLAPVEFDEETLGGWISYSNVIAFARSLEGELKGLVIRYDPPTTPTPALSPSADTTQINDQANSNRH